MNIVSPLPVPTADLVNDDGWVRSDVFGRSFQLIRDINPLGQPRFVVTVKE